MPPTPQPSNSQIYRQSLVDAREAWAKQSGLTQAQVKGAYQQAATSLGSRVAAAPPTAPSTAWNLSQLQQVVQDYGNTLDQRVLDAMHAGIQASFHDAADSVLKTKTSDAYGSVFGPEAVDAHVRDVNQRAAASYITRTGKDGLKLSDRIWKTNAQWRQATQQVVQTAVIAGQPPVQVARQIEQYLQPGVNVPYKAATAKRLKVPKDTSMPAMRVARTEMQNSFHEGTISSHSSMPSYLGIRWHIASALGHETDICDTYAAQGFFPKGTEPLKPHPHCFCTAVPVHKDADEVLDDLDEWLAKPSSHPELEAYYAQIKPLLDVEIASVAGASGGPLLGGHAKGDKVLIDVKGTEVIATVVGEHATKGVLTLLIDPGQGLASIKVWRAPSKVKAYGGPPTPAIPLTPVAPNPLVSPFGGLDVGHVVYATAGQHLGKVGIVQATKAANGTLQVFWEDGTSNWVVHQNLQATPAPTITPTVGQQVKLNMPEQALLHTQLGTITHIDSNDLVTVEVTINNQAFDFTLEPTSVWKLEAPAAVIAVPPPVPPHGLPAGYQTSPAEPVMGGKVLVTAQGPKFGQAGTVDFVGGVGVHIKFDQGGGDMLLKANITVIEPVTAPPTPSAPGALPTIGYFDAPGAPNHGKPVASLDAASGAMQYTDGTWAYGIDPAWVVPTPPPGSLHAPTTPPAAPAPVQAATPAWQPKVGDAVTINDIFNPHHGAQGVLDLETPSFWVIKLPTTTVVMSKPDLLTKTLPQGAPAAPTQTQTVAAPAQQVPQLGNINHLYTGHFVTIHDPGGALHGQSFELAEDVDLISAQGDIPLWEDATHQGVIYLPKQKAYDPTLPLIDLQALARPEATLQDLIVGDQAVDTHTGDTVYLGEVPHWSLSGGLIVYKSKADFDAGINPITLPVADLDPVPGMLIHAETPLHQLAKGDKAIVNDPTSNWHGKEVYLEMGALGMYGTSTIPVTDASGAMTTLKLNQLTTTWQMTATSSPGHLAPPPASATGGPVKDLHAHTAGDLVMIKPGIGIQDGGTVVELVDSLVGLQPHDLVTVKYANGTTNTLEVSELKALPPSGATIGQQFESKDVKTLQAGDKVIVKSGHAAGQEMTVTQPYDPASDLLEVKDASGGLEDFYPDELLVHPDSQLGLKAAPLPKKLEDMQAGDTVIVNSPGDPYHGQPVTLMHDLYGYKATDFIDLTTATGGYLSYYLQNLAVPRPAPPPVVQAATAAPVGSVDVTQKGTKVTTDYKGATVTGTVQSYNAGKKVLVIKPDGPVPGLTAKTFTKSPGKVQALVTPAPAAAAPPAPPPPVQTQTPPAAALHPIDHLVAGDAIVINSPGSIYHGQTGKLMNPSVAQTTSGFLVVEIGGSSKTFLKADLASPTPPPPPSPQQVALDAMTQGATVIINAPGSVNHGYEALLLEATMPTNAADMVNLHMLAGPQAGQDVVYFKTTLVAPGTPIAPTAPVPAPPAAAAGPVMTKTTKGAIVTTEYQGTPVTAMVKSFNAGKNVVMLKPVTPGLPGVPAQFQKSPSKVTLVPQPGVSAPATPAVPVVTTPPPVAAPAPAATPTLPPGLTATQGKPATSPSTMQATHQVVGGGHTKAIYKDATDNSTWMFKPDPNAARAEQAGYNVQALLGIATPETHVITHNGQVGSFQKFHPGIKGEVALHAVKSLTDAQRAQLQQHQVVDWLISQHDSNEGAMLIGANDEILAVDKGQAFKFLLTPGEKLHWTYKPNPNQLVYQPLFEGYIGNKFALQRSAIEPILQKIEALDDQVFKDAIKPYVDHAVQQGLAPNEAAIYDKLLKRKHSIRADFDKLYDQADQQAGRSSGPSLRQAAPAVPAPPVVAATSSAVSTNQVTPITPVLATNVQRAGTHGKAVLVGGRDIENGTVHVFQMPVTGDGTKLVISAKVRAGAEAKLKQHLEGLPANNAAPPPSPTSTAPPADPEWTNVLTVLKHVGSHTKPTGDQQVTGSKVAELIILANNLKTNNLGWTAQKSGYYADLLEKMTGHSVVELAAKTPDVLAAELQTLWIGNTALHAAAFGPYVAPPPPPPVASAAPPPPPPPPTGKFKARSESPSYLVRRLSNGDLITDGVTRTDSSFHGILGRHEWFIDDLGGGMSAQYMPHYGKSLSPYESSARAQNNPYSRMGRLEVTLDNWQGTHTEIEAALQKLNELGLEVAPASPQDVELLYLANQVHAMGLESSSKYTSLQASINDTTPVSEQISKHQKFLSDQLGTDVTKLPTYDPVARFDNGYRIVGTNGHEIVPEAGKPYFERLDISAQDLAQKLPNRVLTHDSTAGTENFLKVLLDGNGAMANTEERVRQALFDPSQGMSSVTDMYTGGASYFFTRLARTTHGEGSRGPFWFDIDLMRRTDMLAYKTDTYGRSDPNTKKGRYTDLDDWRTKQHVAGNNEVVIKNGFPLLDYLVRLSAKNATERNRFIKYFKDRGISQIRGKPIEDIVQVGFP